MIYVISNAIGLKDIRYLIEMFLRYYLNEKGVRVYTFAVSQVYLNDAVPRERR